MFNSSHLPSGPPWFCRLALQHMACLVCFSWKPRNKDSASSCSSVQVKNPEVKELPNIPERSEKKTETQPGDSAVLELKKLGRDLKAILSSPQWSSGFAGTATSLVAIASKNHSNLTEFWTRFC
ncbi:5-hydroxytryptamine receptor 3A-like [Arapaima gigas]